MSFGHISGIMTSTIVCSKFIHIGGRLWAGYNLCTQCEKSLAKCDTTANDKDMILSTGCC